MDLGSIKKVNINDEMQQSFLDYAMSVIVSRAIPDARDGLKPVQRRILYAMYDMGLRAESAHKKSARIVGEVLGKYHPHGDMAVYEAMARMAQDFSERYLLVDGQGNFGSIDGDPPAAMRYTEARLTQPSMELLRQLDMDTVDYVENFDGTLQEPEVLPSALPNLLINGASGIAVGMATSIPPHNLAEIVDGLVLMLNNWDKIDDVSIEDLMKFIKGPDFPTGALIVQDDQSDLLPEIYGSGNGKVQMRALVRLEEMSRGRMRIIVSELPYMTNKSNLISKIADLTRNGTLDGVVDLRDESDRHGMRIVIELSKNADPEKILTLLYKKTPMQGTFSFNMLALVNGGPHKLSLKQALKVYIEHRLTVIRRRSEHELRKNEERLHILKALKIALMNLDEVIEIIKSSRNAETASAKLQKRFKLDELQATAILDMPLRRLASLERKKIEEEYDEISKRIKELKLLLKSPAMMRQLVIDELEEVKRKYSDPRRTQIIQLGEGSLVSQFMTQSDLMPEEYFWISYTNDGRISRSADDKSFRMSGTNASWNVIRTSSHQTVFLVTSEGTIAAIHSMAIPVQNSHDEGVKISTISPLHEKDLIVSLFSVPIDTSENSETSIVSISRMGMVKKSNVADLPSPSAASFTLVKVNDGDELFCTLFCKSNEDLMISTANGMSIRFNEDQVRSMGLVAAGVNGIKLKDDDFVVGAGLIHPNENIILLTKNGLGKRVLEKEFPVQGRYGQGVIAWRLSKDDKVVLQLSGKLTDRAIVHFEKSASKFIKINDAPSRTRSANGKAVFDLKSKDEIIGFTRIEDMVDYWA